VNKLLTNSKIESIDLSSKYKIIKKKDNIILNKGLDYLSDSFIENTFLKEIKLKQKWSKNLSFEMIEKKLYYNYTITNLVFDILDDKLIKYLKRNNNLHQFKFYNFTSQFDIIIHTI
jgi:hypothetical protein